MPKIGYSTPAATGIPTTLYTKAKNRFSCMFFITALLSFLAFTIPFKSPFTKVISALSIAISVPVPIAMPTLACAKAGASLIPSPAIATIFPSACKRATSACLF